MIRTLVTGVAGRMGSTLARLLRESSDMTLVGGTEQKGSPAVGSDVGSGALVHDDLGKAIEQSKALLVIDFTAPEASLAHARLCAERGVALVIGSTGMTEAIKAEIASLASRIPVVMSPNMSVGVNVMFKVAAQLARALGESFDVEIVEAHHKMKKDAPSGTALRLAEDVAKALGRDASSFRMARQGQVGERTAKEIGIQTLRGGDVVGEHTVFFFGSGERLELTHRATSRDQFALGALRAGRWLVGQKPGLYDMQDVLGLKGALS